MTDDGSRQLDYAPKPHALRGARARRIALVAGALLLLLVIAWITPRAFRRLQLAHWQRQCLTYVAPPDRVIHETDPAEVPKLLALPLPYQGSLAAGHAFLIPPPYRNLVVSQSVGTAFLHERVPPRGDRRLVAVDLFTTTIMPNKVMSFSATAIDPSSAVHGPSALITLTRGDGVTVTLQPGDTFRVFAGQPDPDDVSHFTIDYLVNDTRHTVDGWLVDDGMVRIEARD